MSLVVIPSSHTHVDAPYILILTIIVVLHAYAYIHRLTSSVELKN